MNKLSIVVCKPTAQLNVIINFSVDTDTLGDHSAQSLLCSKKVKQFSPFALFYCLFLSDHLCFQMFSSTSLILLAMLTSAARSLQQSG